MNYHHLRYFWLVARTGNLTRAAQASQIAQSALSMQIHALEQAIGQELFTRSGRRLVLTEAGRVVYEYADVIFQKGEELQGVLRTLSSEAQQPLRIGALATLSRNFQLEFVRPLLAHGNIFTIRSGRLTDLVADLASFTLDLVLSDVMPSPVESSGVLVHHLGRQAVSVVGQAARHTIGQSVADIFTTEAIVLPARPSSIRIDFDAYIERMQLRPRILAEIDDMAMLRVIARVHDGVTIVPPIVVKDELARGELVELAQIVELRETFYALTLPRRYPHAQTNLLLEHAATWTWNDA